MNSTPTYLHAVQGRRCFFFAVTRDIRGILAFTVRHVKDHQLRCMSRCPSERICDCFGHQHRHDDGAVVHDKLSRTDGGPQVKGTGAAVQLHSEVTGLRPSPVVNNVIS